MPDFYKEKRFDFHTDLFSDFQNNFNVSSLERTDQKDNSKKANTQRRNL